MIVLGVTMIGLGFYPWSQTNVVEIPGEASVYINWDIAGYIDGHLSGHFTTDVGTINLFILTSEQYQTYKRNFLDPEDSLYSFTGSSGSFSIDLPDLALSFDLLGLVNDALSVVKYHICVDHGTTEGVGQTVTLHMETKGTCVVFIWRGMVTLVTCIGGTVLASRRNAKEDAAMRRP